MQLLGCPTAQVSWCPAGLNRQPKARQLWLHGRPPSSSSHSSSLSNIRTSYRPNKRCVGVRFQCQQYSQDADVSSRGTSSSSCTSSSSSSSEDSAAAVMVAFLSAYGLQQSDIQRLYQEYPQLFEDCSSSSSSSSGSNVFGAVGSCTAGWSPYSYEEEAAAQAAQAAAGRTEAAAGAAEACTSVYEVGRTLLFFHSLGWSHSSVMRRIVGLYPQLLTKQVDRDIMPVLEALTAMGCSDADVQLLVWEFPRIFCSSNWRRHIRKFQYLGLYGLPPPGQSGSSNSSTADRLGRLLQWY